MNSVLKKSPLPGTAAAEAATKTVPVSAIIPCFNCVPTIETTVASVARQRIRPATLILVDDASTDATLPLLHEVRQRYGAHWIRVIARERNGGPAAALNTGWDDAPDGYVAFLGADDAWHPRKIELQYGWMMRHPEVVLTGHRCSRVSRRFPPEVDLPESFKSRRIGTLELLLSNRIPASSAMLRRDLPLRFESTKRYAEDYLLWLEITLKGHPVWLLGVVLGYFFKAPFGESGLTGDLGHMEKGELDSYLRIYRQGLLSGSTLGLVYVISIVKYLRRLLLSRIDRQR